MYPVGETIRLSSSTVLAVLTECQGPGAGREHELGAGSFRIGRAVDAEVLLQDADVSRFHAELTVDADGASLLDLESKNGLSVDGKTVDSGGRSTLSDGSRISLGNVVLELSHPGMRVLGALSAGGQATYTRSIREPQTQESVDTRVPMAAAAFFGIVIVALLLFGG